MSQAFLALQSFLLKSSGLALDREKQYLVEARLNPVIDQAGLNGLAELVARIEKDRALAKKVTEAMTVNETFFFRDRAPFEGFRNAILPELLKARARTRRIRLWSAACSTGQEPYSLAMILDEEARKLGGWSVDIVATDIADSVLKRAREGVYSHFEAQRGVPMSHLVRYFTKRKDQWAINQSIKARIDFRQQNLMSDFSPLGVFDVILCRNVLIYFAPEQKRDVLARMARALAPDGYLVLGAAESVIGYSSEFKPHGENRVILTRRMLGEAQAKKGLAF
ncbi:protein-glutamate O-methyltransferase CheR [Rhodoblastus acidophilus]|uniref:protein-glutamate O-methyltransferase n=1 Tax=Candidatus Rhodoblastus alkanivorans TaxID=2954117 RepID=A0ABS9Z3L7_9HYPH|nr:protein-glutamate O-methyltransferase CheR [Candidatus Rhodoblastus alkanivorans]MCI4678819.1 protein-glutamate O-methyltransferase CheR [Candidatus Rhodoblastus alkanivorans]MCI4682208.1 protein-glutamate O-methyltransferase CheR [Candidatus Rhodoblastus alkanivorans]MDI4639510.1 protein-glutamate O-methyltransferase CheR [Rhodoblastus acidophilus]